MQQLSSPDPTWQRMALRATAWISRRSKRVIFFSRNNFVQADGEEHTITLHQQLHVSGVVKDAVSKQPIASFKAIPGSVSAPDQASWERHGLVYGTNGDYKLSFDEFQPPFQVRFEADGYEVVVSDPLDHRITQQILNMELRRQDSNETISGTVILPDGTAAASAQVGLCTRDQGVTLSRMKFLKQDREILASADGDGHFSFAPEPKAHTIVAVHAQGFASLPVNRTNGVMAIQLERWGRIDGTLKLKNHSNAGQQIVFYRTPGPAGGSMLTLDINAFSAKTVTGRAAAKMVVRGWLSAAPANVFSGTEEVGLVNAVRPLAMDYIAATILATTAVAALLCRYRFTHHQKISRGTLAVSVLIGNFIAFLLFTFSREGWGMFSVLGGSKGSWFLMLIVLAISSISSILPALALTVYYTRRSERA